MFRNLPLQAKGANCTLALSVSAASRSRLYPRTVTRGSAGRANIPLKFPPLEECVGQSLKNLGPSQKTLRHTWCPKLVTGLLCPDGPRVYLSGPAYMPGCIRPDFHLINVFCEVIVVKKYTMSSAGSLLLFGTA